MTLFSFSHLLLLTTAAIWGFAFVAQSTGMDHLGPHSFNMARMILGALSLLPVWFWLSKGRIRVDRRLVLGSLAAGTVLTGGFTFQQMGLQYTTAGNAGFITGMYIVMVPLAGIFLGHATRARIWIAVLLAIQGLWLLSVGPDFHINYGDGLELLGAMFWAAHVLVIGALSRKTDAVGLAVGQMVVAALWASLLAFGLETPRIEDFAAAWLPLVYTGVASTGIAFTLQIIAQKRVEPAVAALLLSLEAVFALVGGWWLLDEAVGSRELIGGALMLSAMLISQWPERRRAVQASPQSL